MSAPKKTRQRVAKCGTYGGYQKHRRQGEPACEPCRKANANYHRGYRASGAEPYLKSLEVEKARTRALYRLAERHPVEFAALFADEKEGAA